MMTEEEKQQEINRLEKELNRLFTLTGTYRWKYDGGGKWWLDDQYLEWKNQIIETRTALKKLQQEQFISLLTTC
jgi:hypothetical protein